MGTRTLDIELGEHTLTWPVEITAEPTSSQMLQAMVLYRTDGGTGHYRRSASPWRTYKAKTDAAPQGRGRSGRLERPVSRTEASG